MRKRTARFTVVGIALGGVAAALFYAAPAFSARVEAIYTGIVYPAVIRGFSWATGVLPFSVAEVLTVAALLAVGARVLLRVLRRFGLLRDFRFLPRRPAPASATESATGATGVRHGPVRRTLVSALFAAAGAGALFAAFVAVWGLNYARPRLAPRLALDTDDISTSEIASLARRAALEATRAHLRAGLPSDEVSKRPMNLRELSSEIDRAYDAVALPGDPRPGSAAPVKPAALSGVMSRMGISGIFVPFTGEPTVNTGPPDVAVTFTAAHEKAHQRAVTHEGEASFAAWVALSRGTTDPYLRYAASFFAARHLLAAARRADEDERRRAWAALGPGPRMDLEALDVFWARYRGVARRAARRVNDRYLRTMRVPDGAASYGTVVRLLVGEFRRTAPPALPVTDGDGEDGGG